MAKAKQKLETLVGEQDVALAVKAICCVTGCGALTAKQFVQRMPTSSIASIAAAEASGKRSTVPQILATIQDSDDSNVVPPGGQGSDA